MKIKNLKRFITFIAILICTTIATLGLLGGNYSFSHTDSIKTKTIYASSGDTLWTIAQTEQKKNKYYEDKNIKEIIEDIKSINNLKNSNIYDSQELTIPYI